MNFVMLILQDGSTTKNQILAKKLGIVVVRRKDFQPNKNVKNVNASDLGLGMAIDNNNSLYITGGTVSTTFPTTCPTTPFPLSDFIPNVSYYQDQVNGASNDWTLGSDGFIARFDLSSVVGIEELLDDTYNGGFQDAFVTEICVDLITSVEKINTNENDFHLYPNPTSENITINFTTQGNKQIEIYSIEGKQIAIYFSDKNQFIINTSSFAKGSYVVKVITEKEVQTVKFIKQ
jgi:hypothetical protein